MSLNSKESRQERIERTLAGTGPLYQVGKLLAGVKNDKTLAQLLAEGEEIGVETFDFPHSLPGEFCLSLKSIQIWGCPFCGTAHGSGFGASRTLNAASLENNQFYYNPLTRQLFTISATCLRKQSSLAERFTDAPILESTPVPLSADPPVAPMIGGTKRDSEAYWVRKSVAFMFACYCGLVAYSHLFWRGKNT